jgi:hypothetical protein
MSTSHPPFENIDVVASKKIVLGFVFSDLFFYLFLRFVLKTILNLVKAAVI